MFCSGLTTLQFQSNGDVTVCSSIAPVGNITTAPIRQIWGRRLPILQQGCCQERRWTEAERERIVADGAAVPSVVAHDLT